MAQKKVVLVPALAGLLIGAQPLERLHQRRGVPHQRPVWVEAVLEPLGPAQSPWPCQRRDHTR
eukprot:CAMPEP_0204331516 /NCGR_PEP_ID=MMETSP0469-20131031/15773_1 /ASSEMBLY_ACC=CAM_ASM_000384 /TAXON_ID=2969 /ORGANISM="Oxyrrhis marina" /LENGTH=62 /DNA_ID=CAMNT_0051314537 /DNA_START=100 /DNA_END=284 /DNA_ORIENTATION=-